MSNPRPTPTTPFQESLYDALEPIADQDEEQNWALLEFCGAIASMFDQVEGYSRDTEDDRPGWSQILDPTRAPEETLAWLHQITGTRPLPGLSVADQRSRVLELSGQKRGTVGAMIAAAQRYLSGTKSVTILERTPDPYSFAIQTLESETPVTDFDDRTNLVTNPAFRTNTAGWTNQSLTTFAIGSLPASDPFLDQIGFALHCIGDADNDRAEYTIPVIAGRKYWFSLYLYVQSLVTASGITVEIRDAGGALKGSVGPYSTLSTWARQSSGLITADSTGNWTIRVRQSGVGSSNFYIAAVLAEEAEQLNPYGDGAFAGWSWNGAANASTSTKPPTTNFVKNALLEQKPAGLVMSYSTVAGGTYLTLRVNYVTYAAADAAYSTYNGMRNNLPGT